MLVSGVRCSALICIHLMKSILNCRERWEVALHRAHSAPISSKSEHLFSTIFPPPVILHILLTPLLIFFFCLFEEWEWHLIHCFISHFSNQFSKWASFHTLSAICISSFVYLLPVYLFCPFLCWNIYSFCNGLWIFFI